MSNSPDEVINSVSEKKLAANRRNAQKSTGPKTRRGKNLSSRNSWLHGLSQAAQVRGDFSEENEKETAKLQKALHEHYRPIGAWEKILTNKLVADLERLRRAYALEASLFTRDLQPFSKSQYEKTILQLDEAIEAIQWARQHIKEVGYLDQDAACELMSKLRVEPFGRIIALSLWMLSVNTHFLLVNAYRPAPPPETVFNELDTVETYLCKTRDSVAVHLADNSNIEAYRVPSDRLTLVVRYRSDIERSVFRTVLELERVQARRLGTPVIPPAVLDVRT